MKSLNLIKYFMMAYPGRSALMICCFLVSGLSEGLSVLTLLPVLQLAISGDIAGNSLILRIISTILATVGLRPTLPALLFLIVASISLKSSLLWLAMKQAGYTIAYVTSDLRLNLIRALMSARWSYFVSQPSGNFANAISSEAMRAAGAYHHASFLIASIIQVTVYSLAAAMVSWKVTLFALIAASLLLYALKGLVKMSRGAGAIQTELMKSMISRLTDVLYGIKPIKAMAQEQFIQPLLEAETNDLNKAQQRQVLASESLKAFQEPLLAVMIAIGLYISINFGSQQFSTLLILVFLFNRLLSRFYFAQSCYQDLALGESALWSLQDSIRRAVDEREDTTGERAPPPLENTIMFDAVNFSYGDKEILKGITMCIPAGNFVVITGSSGAGKTTIADLIAGLFFPQSGVIYIDNVPLNQINLHLWRKMIGYVPQEMFLLHNSVYHNVTFGDDTIARRDVEDALRDAGIWDFVSSLPSGMGTLMGERGSKLSGGQRQRIAIARAIVRKPKLLILDEITTALDPETEAEICDTLRRLSGRVTIIGISHQPAIMKVADLIYHLDDGCIHDVSSEKLAQI